VNIAFPGQDLREREGESVGHLARVFLAAEADGLIASWFFIRKARWRVRYLPAKPQRRRRDDRSVHSLLTRGVDWTGDIYEPELHNAGIGLLDPLDGHIGQVRQESRRGLKITRKG
jgi:hypothetical protein